MGIGESEGGNREEREGRDVLLNGALREEILGLIPEQARSGVEHAGHERGRCGSDGAASRWFYELLYVQF